MRILRAETYRVMPWKNGQGATREIAVYPDGASLDDFMWRISLAQVDAAGPFSLFPNCDRVLCLVRGGPLYLSVAKAPAVRVAIDSPPFHFAADVETAATVLEDRVVDFNVVVRRGDYRVSVAYHNKSLDLPASSHSRFVFVKEGSARTADNEILQCGDTLSVGGERTKIAAGDGTVLYVVTLLPE